MASRANGREYDVAGIVGVVHDTGRYAVVFRARGVCGDPTDYVAAQLNDLARAKEICDEVAKIRGNAQVEDWRRGYARRDVVYPEGVANDRHDPAIDERVAELYRAGRSGRQIAALLGISVQGVYQRLDRVGVARRKAEVA